MTAPPSRCPACRSRWRHARQAPWRRGHARDRPGVATGVTLCLFDTPAPTPIPLRKRRCLARVRAGHRPGTGIRVPRRWPLGSGLWPAGNPAKLLLDPYAKAFSGSSVRPRCSARTRPTLQAEQPDLGARAASLVTDPQFHWQDDNRPGTARRNGPVQIHVKGFTMRHPTSPGAPRDLRLGHQAAIAHLLDLGVPPSNCCRSTRTCPVVPRPARADELLGLQHHRLLRPAQRLPAVRASRPGGQVAVETMVDALHRALEVVLDVVFNHTARRARTAPRCASAASTGHTGSIPATPASTSTDGLRQPLNAGTRQLQLMMDSLRYWLTEMHADGFRFDLARHWPARRAAQQGGGFLDMCSRTRGMRAKLIAEPGTSARWTATTSAASRRCGGSGTAGTGIRCATSGAATRSGSASSPRGSADRRTFTGPTRPPAHRVGEPRHRPRRLHAARTLVSHDSKHNEANGEGNRDGTDDNRSWNCGVEVPPTDPGLLALRARQSRALLTTLMLSFGVPLLLGGDEMGRTQDGNNNAYCQDNEMTWFDWANVDAELLDFTKRLIAFRRAHPVFRRRRFLAGGRPPTCSGSPPPAPR